MVAPVDAKRARAWDGEAVPSPKNKELKPERIPEEWCEQELPS